MKPGFSNFWEINPDLLILSELKTFYDKDKSKNKEESSNILWGIYHAYNPESALYNLPNKLEAIAKDFYKNPKFNWDSIQSIVSVYKNLVLSDAERALVNWGEIITMRDDTIKKLYKEALIDNDTDELVKLDKMMANTPKLFEDYKKIKRDYEEEKTTKKGKHIKSLTETGEL